MQPRYFKPLIGFCALAALAWTGTGESADPVLHARDLPLTITQSCYESDCDQAFNVRWLNDTPSGHLFLVSSDRCDGGAACGWLVEKTRRGVDSLLAFQGRFRLVNNGHAHPDVAVKSYVSATELAYSYYRWKLAPDGRGAYVKSAARRLYEVDGAECGTASQCQDAAVGAVRDGEVGKALRIYEKVEGVSWI